MNTQSLDQDERFHDLLADYLRRVDRGEQVDQAAFLSAHPDYGTALADYFEGASVIENMAGPRVGPVDAQGTVHGQAEAETSSEGIREAMTAVSRKSAAESGEQILENFGRYKILKALGQGAMGAVYLAQDTQLERQVALKIPKFTGAKTAELLARFYREARAAAKLRHPNICPVFDVGEIDGRHYITMAFIAGKPLSEFARAKKRQPEKNVAVVIRKLALGLAEAHAHGIIHRDLKPANIMVDTKGEPVVMDFGLARREEGDDKHVTREGAILGTPAYMSPEQVEGDQSKIGPPADIYSLGVVMYELLTGKVPFGGSLMSILMQIASEQPQPPALHRPGLDGRLEAICLKMMAKRTKDRYASMNEVAVALGEYLKSPTAESSVGNASASASVGNALRGVPSESVDNAPSSSGLLGAPINRHLPVARRLESTPKSDLPGSFTVVPGDLHAPLLTRSASEASDFFVTRSVSEGPKPTRGLSEALRHRAQRIPPKTWLTIGSGLASIAILFAAVTLYIRLGNVDLKVVIDDPSLAVKFEGKSVTFEDSGKIIRVRPGERKFIVEHNGLTAETHQFVLNKEGKNILEVKIVDGRVVVTKNGHASLAKRDPEPNDPKSGWHGWPTDAPPPAIAPFDAKQAKAHQEAWAAYLNVPVEYTNSIGMKFRLIPPGEFLMGSTPEEIETALKHAEHDKHWQECIKSELPRHTVVLTKPTFLSIHEVTQNDYELLMGKNPSYFSSKGDGKEIISGIDTAAHPVEMVTWNDAAEFCAKLSEKEKRKPFYSRTGDVVTAREGTGYRLPSEAEWEYACRGGTMTRFWIGDKDEDLPRAAWFSSNSANRNHAVGELNANPFGLFDIHGNVWEWVQDRWAPSYYGQFKGERAINPSGADPSASMGIIRGGTWLNQASGCRSSLRLAVAPTFISYSAGFRLSLMVDAVREAINDQAQLSTTEKLGRPNWPNDAPPPAIAPFDAKQAKAHQEAWAKYLKVPVEYTNSIGMKFLLIPPGEFLMGSTPEEVEAALRNIPADWNDGWRKAIKSETPQHKVILTQPFYLGTHEVTQGDYERVTGKNPSQYAATGSKKGAVKDTDTTKFPVEYVTWHDASDFCAKLSQQQRLRKSNLEESNSKQQAVGSDYRLPTDAEWEFACRGGTTTLFWNGDSYKEVTQVSWNWPRGGAHAVGELKSNPFGLCDMHGNVWEWVNDRWEADYFDRFRDGAAIDPTGPESATAMRVMRGGTHALAAVHCRSANRPPALSGERYADRGFRVAISVEAVRTGLDK